jgi:enoyl-CoA hydratase
MTDTEGTIRVERKGHVQLMGIDRPKKLNGFSQRMVMELNEAYDAMERNPEVRVGLLHAIGPNFTAGVQLDQNGRWFAEGRHA